MVECMFLSPRKGVYAALTTNRAKTRCWTGRILWWTRVLRLSSFLFWPLGCFSILVLAICVVGSVVFVRNLCFVVLHASWAGFLNHVYALVLILCFRIQVDIFPRYLLPFNVVPKPYGPNDLEKSSCSETWNVRYQTSIAFRCQLLFSEVGQLRNMDWKHILAEMMLYPLNCLFEKWLESIEAVSSCVGS